MFDPPPFDPREQPVLSAEQIRAAKIAHNQERIENGYPPDLAEPLTEDQLAVLDAQEAIQRLAVKLGSYHRLVQITKSIAWMHGEDTERPLNRCLADGVILPTSRICPRCGRDNS